MPGTGTLGEGEQQGRTKMACRGGRQNLPFCVFSRAERIWRSRASGPRVTLVLGADKNGVDFEKREVWLVRWDRDFFAQAVVSLAFWDPMTPQRRMAVAKRALADARMEVAVKQ